jgi:hypothetical protein
MLKDLAPKLDINESFSEGSRKSQEGLGRSF